MGSNELELIVSTYPLHVLQISYIHAVIRDLFYKGLQQLGFVYHHTSRYQKDTASVKNEQLRFGPRKDPRQIHVL